MCFVFRQVLGRFLVGSWWFLAVLGGAWALAGQKWEPQIDKTDAWGAQNGTRIDEDEVSGVSGSLWGTRRLQECNNGAAPEFFGCHFGSILGGPGHWKYDIFGS